MSQNADCRVHLFVLAVIYSISLEVSYAIEDTALIIYNKVKSKHENYRFSSARERTENGNYVRTRIRVRATLSIKNKELTFFFSTKVSSRPCHVTDSSPHFQEVAAHVRLTISRGNQTGATSAARVVARHSSVTVGLLLFMNNSCIRTSLYVSTDQVYFFFSLVTFSVNSKV
jgi:hypothetical protein